MPADHKVSVAWQIVFTFLPIVNFWAFYRIRKLRRYVLYVIVPSIVISIVIATFTVASLGLIVESSRFSEITGASTAVSYALGAGFQAFTIYLVIIWSRLHNRTFDSQSFAYFG